MNAGQLSLTSVTAVAAIVAAVLSWWAGRQATGQREHQARREDWWGRFQWAIDLTFSDEDAKARVGLTLLASLADSPLATTEELDAMSAVTDEICQASLARVAGAGKTEFVQVVGDHDHAKEPTDAHPGDQDRGAGREAPGQDRPQARRADPTGDR